MDLIEYREQAKAIREEAEEKVKELAKEYAFANSTVKKGDVITSRLSHGESIIVDKIRFTRRTSMVKEESPECVYFGPLLTKKGKPRKDGKRSWIYHSDLLIDK